MDDVDEARLFARTKVDLYPLPGMNHPVWSLGFGVVELLMAYLNDEVLPC